jgi:glycosyltransferase involved in cell wall biosynthesis
MKIVHITHTDILSDSRILKEISSLLKMGYSVSGVGVGLDDGSKKINQKIYKHLSSLELVSSKFIFLPKTIRHIFLLFELTIKMVPKVIHEKPDLVHCHDTLVLPIGVVLKLITKAKLVYDAHELESNRNALSPILGKLIFLVEKLIWPLVDGLIVVSPSIERWYHENVGLKTSQIILNSPITIEDKKLNHNYLRKKFAIPLNCNIFIYVGILGRGRGLDFIIKAFCDQDINSHLVLIGYGELAEKIKNFEIEFQNIHLHEPVQHSQVVSIIKSANFGLCLIENVSLSDYYCLPNKLFEYCFAGLPVLASDFPDLREIVSQYQLGICCSVEFEAIKNTIKSLENSKVSFDFADLTALTWMSQELKLSFLYDQILGKEY